ncbi:GIY-YIG nuclease family protein [Nostoc sp.]|uniref:GIY-YIG nuclease family protein n=1 Tax=Nostoc sp. TaxID=1180 RepID=UPI002FFCD0BD
MINASNIDIDSLPSVYLTQTSRLPQISGVYLAIDSQGIVQYIGQSTNLLSRWRAHHRHKDLQKLDGVRICYLAISDISMLEEIERALIEYFNPYLNGLSMSLEPLRAASRNHDKGTGKFIKKEDTNDYVIAIRVNADLKAWVQERGGSIFVRSVILKAKLRHEREVRLKAKYPGLRQSLESGLVRRG